MIQANFSSYKTVSQSSSVLTPIVPGGGGVSDRVKQSLIHKRNSKFTERIIYHGGPTPLTSMEAAARAKKRENNHLKIRFNAVDSLVSDFEAESARLMKLQKKLHDGQMMMELNARRIFASIKIQTVFRCYQARYKLRALKSIRFLTKFIRFKFYYKRRKYAAKRITDCVRTYQKRKVFRFHLLRIRSAKVIQRKVRLYNKNKVIRSFMILLSTLKNTVRHVLLFGARKAFHTIRALKYSTIHNAQQIAIRKFISACIYRKRCKT